MSDNTQASVAIDAGDAPRYEAEIEGLVPPYPIGADTARQIANAFSAHAPKAEAAATKIKGEAEAAAIRARSDALRDSPKLVDLTAVERWDGKLPATMLPGSSLPFVHVK